MQRWVSTVNVCRFSVCQFGRVITVSMYGWFVNGVCVYGLAVVEAICGCLQGFTEISLGSRRKLPAYQSTSYIYDIGVPVM